MGDPQPSPKRGDPSELIPRAIAADATGLVLAQPDGEGVITTTGAGDGLRHQAVLARLVVLCRLHHKVVGLAARGVVADVRHIPLAIDRKNLLALGHADGECVCVHFPVAVPCPYLNVALLVRLVGMHPTVGLVGHPLFMDDTSPQLRSLALGEVVDGTR